MDVVAPIKRPFSGLFTRYSGEGSRAEPTPPLTNTKGPPPTTGQKRWETTAILRLFSQRIKFLTNKIQLEEPQSFFFAFVTVRNKYESRRRAP